MASQKVIQSNGGDLIDFAAPPPLIGVLKFNQRRQFNLGGVDKEIQLQACLGKHGALIQNGASGCLNSAGQVPIWLDQDTSPPKFFLQQVSVGNSLTVSDANLD